MRVAIVRGGGLAGIATTTQLQSAALSEEDAKALESKLRSSSLLSAPRSAPGAETAQPDGLLYEITVGDGERDQTHRFSEESLPEDVRSLIEWVDSRPERDFAVGS